MSAPISNATVLAPLRSVVAQPQPDFDFVAGAVAGAWLGATALPGALIGA